VQQQTLIDKVVSLFFCKLFDPANLSRVLKSGYMLLLQPFITKKPDEKKLDTETTKMLQEDSAGVLLNGVNHVYGRIRTREQLK
jgi:hypothetical protein